MNGHPRRRLDGRVSVTAATGITAAIAMVLLGMEPRLVLVGFVAITIGAVSWLAVDLGPLAVPLHWTDHGDDGDTLPRSDHRVRALRSRLRSPARRRRAEGSADADRTAPVDDVVVTLIRVIDDHLLAEFGIDRSDDPAAATEVLGAELSRFVADPSARRSMSGRRGLARTVSLIEGLCARTHAA